MDGVIVDTEEFHYRSWRRLFSELGKRLTKKQFLERFGMKSVEILRLSLGQRPPEELTGLARRKEEYYRQEASGKVKALPGVLSTIEQLRRAGFRMALASSAPLVNINLIIDSLGMRDCFDAIVSGDEVKAGKPDPEVFLEAARRLGVPPMRCVVFEDAIAGVQAAKAAGMHCVAVTNSNPRDRLVAADVVVDSLEEIPFQRLERLLD